MANLKKIAGFDVSKSFFDVCILRDGKEQSLRFNYDPEGLSSLITALGEDMYCLMEATGPYHVRLAFHLYQHGYKVSVINPLSIKRFSQMMMTRAKTDKADAKVIAAYGELKEWDLWQPPAAHVIKLQQLNAMEQMLQKHHTATCNQLEAFEATGNIDKEIKKIMLKELSNLKKQLDRVTKQIDAIVELHYKHMFENITSIPGLGKKAATMLITITDGFRKFENYKQISAYLGLSPRIYQSGTSVKGKSRICKMGAGKMRAVLYMCTWSAKTCNKACKELYERIIAKGKAKRLALIAVANKLIKQAFAIATNNTVYQPNYSKNICF
jgi:transposase